MIYIIPTDTCFWIWCAISDIKSYNKIYEIKKRPLDKPLAIMVEDFEYLSKYTPLTKKQIEFLKNYEKPFTILTNSPYIEMFLNLEYESFLFENKNKYKKIAFRVANLDTQKSLIQEVWPIFLTSANYSWQKEIYDIQEAKKQFKPYLKDIEFIASDYPLSNIPPSDIFSFDWDSLNLIYQRQN